MCKFAKPYAFETRFVRKPYPATDNLIRTVSASA